MDKKNYTETLNLPKTEFPMRGNLPEREPYFIARAEENGIYKEILNTYTTYNINLIEKQERNLFFMMVHHMQTEIYTWVMLLIKY